MKKIILISAIGLMISACTTMQPYRDGDKTSEGYKYKYGADRGLRVGAKINAYKRNSTGRGYAEQPIGTLTVSRVEEDYSLMNKDSEFNVDNSTAFMVQ